MTIVAGSMLRKTAVLGLPWVLAACPVCGGGDPIPIQSGTYEAAVLFDDATSFPAASGANIVVEINRSGGFVEITYERDGTRVIERWGIA